MEFPTVSFNEDQPCKMINGVAYQMQISVQPNAVGKWQLKLFLKSISCTFENGEKEKIREEEATVPGEVIEISEAITIISDKPNTLVVTLNALVTNIDDASSKDRLLVKLEKASELLADSAPDLLATTPTDTPADELVGGTADQPTPTDEPTEGSVDGTTDEPT